MAAGDTILRLEWEETVQRWYTLHDLKKKDETKRKEVEHQKLVRRTIKSAEGGTGLFAQNDEAHRFERRFADAREVEDVKPFPDVRRRGENGPGTGIATRRCRTYMTKHGKCWAKHWQCDTKVQALKDKPWRNVEVKNLEEDTPRILEMELEKAARKLQGNERTGM